MAIKKEKEVIATTPKTKSTVKAIIPNDTVEITLYTSETEYKFTGTDLQVLFKLLPTKISGKTSISMTKNGLTYTKAIKPMMLKKYLNNTHFLTILEKQITSLLK